MRDEEMLNKKCVMKYYFQIAPDTWSETLESFLFDFH